MIPSLEGWPTKAKEAPSPDEIRLTPLDTNPVFQCLGDMHNIPFFKTRHTFLKNSFFLSSTIEWNELNHKIRNSSSFNIFRKSTLEFIRLSAFSLFNSHNPKESNLSKN